MVNCDCLKSGAGPWERRNEGDDKMVMYTGDGDIVTLDQITRAVNERRAVICWSHGNWKNIGALYIYDSAEEALEDAERDTRGESWSMWDEVWCQLADSVSDARRAAKGLLTVS